MIRELQLARYSENHESTLGLLFTDWTFFCYMLEDEFRKVKVQGETRIPGGIYQLAYRRVEDSPKTILYRERFDWFRYHIQVLDVPTHEWVYLHIGNDDDDTDGCLLTGDQANNNQVEEGFIGFSTPAFKRLYQLLAPQMELDQGPKLRIFDMQDMLRVGIHHDRNRFSSIQ